MTYLFGARAFSRRAGLVAGTLLALMPRVFFHSHLACFDVPIAAMWILVRLRALARDGYAKVGFILAVGIVFGLALETKHNAWMLPFVLVPHALFVQRHAFWRALRVGRSASRRAWCRWPLSGPSCFVALWPYLWSDTMGRIQFWVNFMLNHEYYNIEYLGKNYFGPPSPKSYLPVMVAATVPATTLLLFFIGAFDRGAIAVGRLRAWLGGVVHRPLGPDVAGDPRETDLLLSLAFFGRDMAVFFLPKTPIFGGTKHWLPAYPVLALYAGRGFDLVAGAMRRALPSLDARRWVAAQAALFGCVTLAPLAVTAHSHPFGLSSYVPLVGGTAGGADLGLNRQFWGYTTQTAAEEFLNPKAPRGATVFILDTTGDAWGRMEEEGRVRRDLRAVGAPHEALFSLVQHELHMSEVDYSILGGRRDGRPGVHRRARRRAHRERLPETLRTYGARQKRSTSKSTTVTPFFVGPTTGSRPFDSTARPPLRRMTSSAYAAWIGRSQGKT